MPESNGPYLNYAVICEKVLRETDEVLTFVRLIDHVTTTVPVTTPAGADASPTEAHPVPLIAITFAVGLKSGDYVGPVPVKVRIEPPSGSTWPEFNGILRMEGREHGAGVILPIQFPVQDEGLYWFAVFIAGELATRVPLRVTLRTETIPSQQD